MLPRAPRILRVLIVSERSRASTLKLQPICNLRSLLVRTIAATASVGLRCAHAVFELDTQWKLFLAAFACYENTMFLHDGCGVVQFFRGCFLFWRPSTSHEIFYRETPRVFDSLRKKQIIETVSNKGSNFLNLFS